MRYHELYEDLMDAIFSGERSQDTFVQRMPLLPIAECLACMTTVENLIEKIWHLRKPCRLTFVERYPTLVSTLDLMLREQSQRHADEQHKSVAA